MTGKTIAAERAYARADVFVAEALGISRSAAKKLLDEGAITQEEFDAEKAKLLK